MSRKYFLQFLYFAFAVIFVFMTVGLWFDSRVERGILEAARYDHAIVGDSVSSNIDEYIGRMVTGVEHAFTLHDDSGTNVMTLLERQYEIVKGIFPEIFSIAFVDPDGKVFFTDKDGIFQDNGVPLEDVLEEDVFATHLESGDSPEDGFRVATSTFMRFVPELSRIVPNEALLFTKTIAIDGKPAGTLLIPYLFDFIIESFLAPVGAGGDFTTWLVSHNGKAIYRSDKPSSFSWLNRTFPHIQKAGDTYSITFPSGPAVSSESVNDGGIHGSFQVWDHETERAELYRGFFAPLSVGDTMMTIVIAAPHSRIVGTKREFVLPVTIGSILLVGLIFGLAMVSYLRLRSSEASLIESENLHRALFEKANDAIFLFHTEDMKFVTANPAACERLEYTLGELSEMGPKDIMRKADRSLIASRIEELKKKSVMQFETEHISKSGKIIPTEIYSRLIEYNGKEAVIVSARDIAIQKLLQERVLKQEKEAANRRSFEMIGRLAGGIAHEFNNILGAILSCLPSDAGRVGEEVCDEECSSEIKALCKRGGYITSQLLGTAREILPSPTPTNIERFMSEFAGVLERTLPPGIKFIFERAAGLPDISTVPAMFHAAMLNLTKNAADAMEGEGLLSILCREALLKDGSAGVAFVVSDTGGGISRDNMAKIFDPFFTTKEPGKGVGLGLSIVKSFVESSGGEISVESGSNGSSFKLIMPVWDAKIAGEADAGRTGRGRGVLYLARDEERSAEVLRKPFGREHDLRMVYSVAELVEKLNEDTAVLYNSMFIEEEAVDIPLNTLAHIIFSIRHGLHVVLLKSDKFIDEDVPKEFFVVDKTVLDKSVSKVF